MLSHVSRVGFFATPRTVARQALLFVEFCSQECWSGLPCPPPGDLSNPGTETVFLTPPTLAGSIFTTSTNWEARFLLYYTADQP